MHPEGLGDHHAGEVQGEEAGANAPNHSRARRPPPCRVADGEHRGHQLQRPRTRQRDQSYQEVEVVHGEEPARQEERQHHPASESQVVLLAPVPRDVALVHVPREHGHVGVKDRVQGGHGRGRGAGEDQAGQPRGCVAEEEFREDPVRLRQVGENQSAAEPHERHRDEQGHQVDGGGGAEDLERSVGGGREVADHHVRLEDDSEGKSDRHADPHSRGEEALRTR